MQAYVGAGVIEETSLPFLWKNIWGGVGRMPFKKHFQLTKLLFCIFPYVVLQMALSTPDLRLSCEKVLCYVKS